MKHGFDHECEDDWTTTPENATDSPLSGDETAEEAYVPSTRKSRRGAQKRVVTVPIDGSGRSKGEVYPPPDSWSWRKYGQKPIKGSPYPRGYYRCSSSKGCPAKKQVERSRLDPTILLITYSADHSHPLPTTTKNHHHHSVAAAVSPPEEEPDHIEPVDEGFVELAGEFGWLCDVGSTFMNRTTFMDPIWQDAGDMEVSMPIGEDDKLLFGDLGDLPESSMIFRRCGVVTPCCGGT